jgi:putative ABC transport system permease protein
MLKNCKILNKLTKIINENREMKILRQLLRDKRNSSIQTVGLVLGIVTCMLVGRYALFEFSFDSFNTDNERIYRTKGSEGRLLASLGKEQLSYIKESARLHPCYRGVSISIDDKSFNESSAYFADGELFDILSFPIQEGDVKEALSHKNQMVISESYAKKLFGDDNPIGQTVIVNGSYENNIIYTIGGVFKDLPQNSHVQFNVLFSMENILVHRMYTKDSPWRWNNFFTYFKTIHPVNVEQLGNDLYQLQKNNGREKKRDEEEICHIQNLNDIHLNGQSNYMDNNSTASDVITRIFIALLIIAIAWTNFINLGFGSALKNKLAYSVKKVMGASSRSIFNELFQKSLILNILALVVSATLFLILNILLQRTGIVQSFNLPVFLELLFWIIITSLQTLGVFAVSLSIYGLFQKQNLANTLSYRSKSAKQNHSPWITLLVLQFSASIVLICFALFSTKQVNGLMSIEKGINIHQVLAIRSAYFSSNENINSDRDVFEQEAIKMPEISHVSAVSYIPGSTISSRMPTRLSGKNEDENISCQMNFVSYDYIPLFGHRLVAGRNFSESFSTDGTAIIINETLCKEYGFKSPQDAIGKEIFWETRNTYRHIIGVMEDFHHQLADIPVEPTMFQFWKHANGYCLLKINSKNPLKIVKDLETLWKKIHHGNAFSYMWIDEHYQKQYTKWVQLVRIMKLLSFIAIFIACIGLFGLSSMLLDKRTKEIGIRKVNGARILEVFVLLNRDFIKWVGIAFFIAIPVAIYTIHKWLEDFAFKSAVSWWIFALAGAIALGIALLTVSWQSWKAATKNPVEALKYE